MQHPGEVDPRRFCKSLQSWESRSSLAGFPRLAHEFTQGELFCRVEGLLDVGGGWSVRLLVQGEVELVCQRCLGGMMQRIEIDHTLRLARNANELERLDAEPDRDAILAGELLDLVELLEDEVLLSLPMVPMHLAGGCPPSGQ
ncbi:MAG: YceD family protein [Thiobacillus sp.]